MSATTTRVSAAAASTRRREPLRGWLLMALLCAVVGVISGSWLLVGLHVPAVLAVPLVAANAAVGVAAWRWR